MRFQKTAKQGFSLIEVSIAILIIGVLVAGVFQANTMVRKFKLITARTATQSSPVQGITGLTLWLDATSEKGFIDSEAVDGTAISNWYDVNPQRQVGSNSVTQSNSSYRPLYSENAIGGLPAIKLDGVNDYLTKTTLNRDDIVSSDQATFFFVINSFSKNITSALFHIDNSAGSYLGSYQNQANTFYFYFGDQSSTGRITFTTSNSFHNRAQVLTLLHKPTNYSEVRSNGALLQSSSSMTNTMGETNPYYFWLGFTGYYFKGYIGEVIFYNRALNNEERSAVEDYLKRKWEIK